MRIVKIAAILTPFETLPAEKHYSRLQKSCNKQAEQWKTTIDLLCLNREVGLAEAGKIIRFIRGKSIVVFHCSAGFVARLLQSAVICHETGYSTLH